MKNWRKILVLSLIGVVLTPLLVKAQASIGFPADFANLSDQDLKTVIENIVRIVFGFLGILAVIFILYGGFVWMTSQGNAERIAQAKRIIVSAVIGLLLILASYAIASFIVNNISNAVGDGDDGPPIDVDPPTPIGCEAINPLDAVAVLNVSPGTPTLGQTVTITGCNFGDIPGTVRFNGATVATADLVICGSDQQWTNNRIKVRVPSSLSLGGYVVEVDTAGGDSCTDTTTCGNASIISGSAPSIDCIDPDQGPSGTIVDITGSNFGSTEDTVLMAGDGGPVNATINPGGWTATDISITVPNTAVSGDIEVRVASQFSNPEYFSVTCTDNAQCATGCCSSNQCREASACDTTGGTPGGPSISSLTPNQGDDGTFVTVRGSNFGSTPGEVHFLHQGNNTDYVNNFPAVCDPSFVWTDRQIIFEVPDTTLNDNAQVWVVRTSDNAQSGTVNFTVNDDPVPPGLCSVDPIAGFYEDTVTLTGEFNGTTGNAYFGGIDGNNTNFLSANSVTSDVPNLQQGVVGVTVETNNLESNPVNFEVVTAGSGGPRIDYIDPVQGAANQYVQIYGDNFGSIGTVFFKDTGGVNTLAATNFPPACGGNFWSNNHITVKVPTTILNGSYTIYVDPANSPIDSNEVAFSKNNDPLSPGICLIDPDTAPVGFSGVDIHGEGFTNSGQVLFTPSTPATVAGWNNTQLSNVTVPAGAQSGLVTVTNSNGITSAGVPFNVDGIGGPVVPTGPQCTYSWSFRTGDLPFGLQINEQCSVESQSPSPFPFEQLSVYDANDVATNAPLNSVISARFTTPIDYSTVSSSISVRTCGTGPVWPGGCSGALVSGTFSQLGNDGFFFVPSGNFAPETWYEVRINNTLLAQNGSAFQFDPTIEVADPGNGNTWHFRTRDGSQPQCVVNSVNVGPDSATILLGNDQRFTSYGYDESSCIICNSPSLSWDWSLADPIATLVEVASNEALVIADQNQVGPTELTASTASFSDTSEVNIVAEEPYVRSYTPGGACVAACTNASPTATFNVPMSAATINATSVDLKLCTNQNCDAFGPDPGITVDYDVAAKTVTITPNAALQPETWYRVIIDDSVTNVFDDPLTSLNYPPAAPDSFSWKFRTGDTVCNPDAVSVSPASTTGFPTQSINYNAKALATSVPGCGPIYLDSSAYDFSWSSSVATVADVTNSSVPNNQQIATIDPAAVVGDSTEISATLASAGLSAAGTLTVVSSTGGPDGPEPPELSLVGTAPPAGGTYCRNAQVSATFTNSIKQTSADFIQVRDSSSNLVPGIIKIGGSKVSFEPTGSLLPASETLTASIVNGTVEDYYSQTLLVPSETWTFNTTDTLCDIDFVTVDPHPYTFGLANSTQGFFAQAYDDTGIAINGASYQWENNTGPIISVPGTNNQTEIISSLDTNGYDYAYVNASGQLGDPPVDIGSARGHSRVTVDICTTPWTPDIDNNPIPYTDVDYDFSVNYCRQKTVNDAILPNLPNPPLVRNVQGNVLREHVFVVGSNVSGNVTPGNEDPSFETIDPIQVNVGELVYFVVQASDPEGDSFVMYANQSDLPPGATFNPYTGVFIWVPQNDIDYTATFNLRDELQDPLDTLQVSIEVNPSATGVSPLQATMVNPGQGSTLQVTAGQLQSFVAQVNGATSLESFVWDFQDPGLSTNYAQSGNGFTVSHIFEQPGIHQVTFRAKDANYGWTLPAVVNVLVVEPTSRLETLKKFVNNIFDFFKFDDAKAQTVGEKYDIIVIRVMRNLEHLDPLTWYYKYAPNPTGNPRETVVDGYPAIVDGTTVYVAAGNINNNNVYTNMYLMTYNEDASAETRDIFNQLLDSWSFNISFIEGDDFSGNQAVCVNDTSVACDLDVDCLGEDNYCTSQKATIRRDVKRYTDIHAVARFAEEYAASHQFCQNAPNTPCSTSAQCPGNGACIPTYPRLSSGTYLAGVTTSKWPSWSTNFPNVLGVSSLPEDPINSFIDCSSLSPNIDPETCWDEIARTFSCPSNSNVYAYKIDDNGAAYQSSGNIETRSRFNWPVENPNVRLNNDLVCTTGVILTGVCGNGILESGEVCDGGFTNACGVNSNNPYYVGCNSNCSGWLPLPSGWDCGGRCGNGVVDAPFEQCEGPNSASFNPSGWSCTAGGNVSCDSACQISCTNGFAYQGTCGNDVVELPEVCDDGSANGTYGNCNSTCSGFNEYCGDGILNGSEECDTFQGLTGFSCPQGTSLYCNDSCQRECSDQTFVSNDPGVCGNGVLEPAGPDGINGTLDDEECEPDLYPDQVPSETNFSNQYVCGDTDAGPLACKITGGYCGDGATQIPYETCDYSGPTCSSNPAISCTTDSDCPSTIIGTPPFIFRLPGVCVAPDLSNGELCNNSTQSCEYCSANCELKFLPPNFCGDGIIDPGPDGDPDTDDGIEACDNGILNGLPGYCNSTCTGLSTGTPFSICGNNIREPGELCDNGSTPPNCSGPGGTCNGDAGACNTTCDGITPDAQCGNNDIEPGEECDDGDLNGQPNQCAADCSGPHPAVCGNNIPEPAPNGNEQCDDGNTVNGDGCDSMCQLEGTGGPTSGICGDGEIDNNTRCTTSTGQNHGCSLNSDCDDLDVYGNGDCYTVGGERIGSCDTTPQCQAMGGFQCANTSLLFNSTCSLPPEVCDDNGNNGQPTFCWTDCSRDTLYCGDNIRTNPNDFGVAEICDDGANNGTVVNGCNATCTDYIDFICGDTIITDPFEQCDDGNQVNGDGCSSSCQNEIAGYCGDSIINNGEFDCDFGCDPVFQPICYANGQTTDPLTSSGQGFCYKCRNWCGDGTVWPVNPNPGENPTNGEYCDEGWAINGTAIGRCNELCNDTVKYFCGDGVVTSPYEQCDTFDADQSQTCDADILSPGPNARTYTYPGSQTRSCVIPSGCSGSSCPDEPNACIWSGWGACTSTEFCGDGIKNGTEECDGGDLGGASCVSEGFPGGTLSCNNNCTINTSNCATCDPPGEVIGVQSCNAAGVPGLQEVYCSTDGQSTLVSTCERFGLQIKSQQADVVYINAITGFERLSLHSQCFASGPDGNNGWPDTNGSYPSSSVYEPAGINECIEQEGIYLETNRTSYPDSNQNIGTKLIEYNGTLHAFTRRWMGGNYRGVIREIDPSTLGEIRRSNSLTVGDPTKYDMVGYGTDAYIAYVNADDNNNIYLARVNLDTQNVELSAGPISSNGADAITVQVDANFVYIAYNDIGNNSLSVAKIDRNTLFVNTIYQNLTPKKVSSLGSTIDGNFVYLAYSSLDDSSTTQNKIWLGRFLKSLGGFGRLALNNQSFSSITKPNDVTFGPDGDLYVSYNQTNAVATREVKTTAWTLGANLGEIDSSTVQAQTIVADDDNVWVISKDNSVSGWQGIIVHKLSAEPYTTINRTIDLAPDKYGSYADAVIIGNYLYLTYQNTTGGMASSKINLLGDTTRIPFVNYTQISNRQNPPYSELNTNGGWERVGKNNIAVKILNNGIAHFEAVYASKGILDSGIIKPAIFPTAQNSYVSNNWVCYNGSQSVPSNDSANLPWWHRDYDDSSWVTPIEYSSCQLSGASPIIQWGFGRSCFYRAPNSSSVMYCRLTYWN